MSKQKDLMKQCEIINIRNRNKITAWLAVKKYDLVEGSVITLKHNDEMYKVIKIYNTELTQDHLDYNRATFASLK